MANGFWVDGFWATDFWVADFWNGLGAVAPTPEPVVVAGTARQIGDSNTTAIAGAGYVHEVVLVKLEFATPVYVHSGYGEIVSTADGQTYLGVGDLGEVAEARETELLGPTPMTLSLSGVDNTLVSEALNSGNYGDAVTIYIGYRQDDGTLVEPPWIAWKGTFEYATVTMGEESVVRVMCQHDLAVLSESLNARFSDEYQQRKYPGDTGFEYVAKVPSQQLTWGGGPVENGVTTGPPNQGGEGDNTWIP